MTSRRAPVRAALLALALTVAAGQGQPAPAASAPPGPQPLGDWLQGTAASYASLGQGSQPGELELGACGYDIARSGPTAWPLAGTAAALPPDSPLRQSLTMSGCGACLEVQCGQDDMDAAALQQAGCIAGPDGKRSSVIVTLVDSCPGCAGDELALHPLAASRLAPLTQPSVPVRYRQVACQAPSNIVVVVEEYALQGEGWLRLHLEKVGGSGGISALWARTNVAGDTAQAGLGQGWKQMRNLEGSAVWELSGVPPAPLDLIIYPALGGRPLLATAIIPTAGATGAFQTAVQVSQQQPGFPGLAAPPTQRQAAPPASPPAAEAAAAQAAPPVTEAAAAQAAAAQAALPAQAAAPAAEAAAAQAGLPAPAAAPVTEAAAAQAAPPAEEAAAAAEPQQASPPGAEEEEPSAAGALREAAVAASLAPAVVDRVQQAVDPTAQPRAEPPQLQPSPSGDLVTAGVPSAEPAPEATSRQAAGQAVAPALAAAVREAVARDGRRPPPPSPPVGGEQEVVWKSQPVPGFQTVVQPAPALVPEAEAGRVWEPTPESAEEPAAQPAAEPAQPPAQPPAPAPETEAGGIVAAAVPSDPPAGQPPAGPPVVAAAQQPEAAAAASGGGGGGGGGGPTAAYIGAGVGGGVALLALVAGLTWYTLAGRRRRDQRAAPKPAHGHNGDGAWAGGEAAGAAAGAAAGQDGLFKPGSAEEAEQGQRLAQVQAYQQQAYQQAYQYWGDGSPKGVSEHQALDYVLDSFPTSHAPPALPPPASMAAASFASGRPPLPPSRLRGAAPLPTWQQQQLQGQQYGRGYGGDRDLLSSFEGEQFAMDRGTSQLDSMVSTWYGPEAAQDAELAASADAAPSSSYLHAQLAPGSSFLYAQQVDQPYGSLPQYPQPPASLPRAASDFTARGAAGMGAGQRAVHSAAGSYYSAQHMASSFPSTRSGFVGGPGSGGGGMAAAPGTSPALRSTAEFGQLNAGQRAQAESSLMATLQEDEMWDAESEASTAPRQHALPVRPPESHSPAFSLDSMHSPRQAGTFVSTRHGTERAQRMPLPPPLPPQPQRQQRQRPFPGGDSLAGSSMHSAQLWGGDAHSLPAQQHYLWSRSQPNQPFQRGPDMQQPQQQAQQAQQGEPAEGSPWATPAPAPRQQQQQQPPLVRAGSGGFAPRDMLISPQTMLETAAVTPREGRAASSASLSSAEDSGPYSLPAGHLRHSPDRPPVGAVPFHVRHPPASAFQAPAPPRPEPADAAAGPGSSASLQRRAEHFLLSADSFSSTTNPALFTRDSADSPMPLGWQQQQQQAPGREQAPLRFSSIRRAAALAAAGAASADTQPGGQQ